MNREEIEAMMEVRGIRPTANRVLVARQLLKEDHPVSLADMESALGYTVDKASIFRVLEIFAERELVHVIEDGTRSLKYEICHSESVHSIADQHPHFYCERCKATYCIERVTVPGIELPPGFEAHSVNYMVKGICAKCRGEE